MTIERSHGSARPTLPRSSDLVSLERSNRGTFLPGNGVARDTGWRRTVSKMLGADATTAAGRSVAGDAARLFTAALRDMPSDGSAVRVLLGSWASHAALQGHFTRRATSLGIETPEALAAAEIASKHGIRAERLIVTALDVSTRLAKRTPAPLDLAAIDAQAERETQARRERDGKPGNMPPEQAAITTPDGDGEQA